MADEFLSQLQEAFAPAILGCKMLQAACADFERALKKETTIAPDATIQWLHASKDCFFRALNDVEPKAIAIWNETFEPPNIPEEVWITASGFCDEEAWEKTVESIITHGVHSMLDHIVELIDCSIGLSEQLEAQIISFSKGENASPMNIAFLSKRINHVNRFLEELKRAA